MIKSKYILLIITSLIFSSFLFPNVSAWLDPPTGTDAYTRRFLNTSITPTWDQPIGNDSWYTFIINQSVMDYSYCAGAKNFSQVKDGTEIATGFLIRPYNSSGNSKVWINLTETSSNKSFTSVYMYCNNNTVQHNTGNKKDVFNSDLIGGWTFDMDNNLSGINEKINLTQNLTNKATWVGNTTSLAQDIKLSNREGAFYNQIGQFYKNATPNIFKWSPRKFTILVRVNLTSSNIAGHHSDKIINNPLGAQNTWSWIRATTTLYADFQGTVGQPECVVPAVLARWTPIGIRTNGSSPESTLEQFINGTACGTVKSPTSLQTWDDLIISGIFNSPNLQNIQGGIDEFFIFNRTLSNGTIQIYSTEPIYNFSVPQAGEVQIFPDTKAPNITIQSPTNTTYNLTSVILSVTADEAITTWNFSNNTQSNIVFTGNYSLNTTQGSNNYTICGNDGTFMNCSRLVFTVDNVIPFISIITPTNITYNLSDIVVSFTSNETINTTLLEHNNGTRRILSGNTSVNFQENSAGFTLYINDSANNTGRAGINFTINTKAPNITVQSPTNTTYNLTAVVLSVTADETITTWNFSNNTQSNIVFNNNITLNVTQGSNNYTICGSDGTFMNCSRLVFSVDSITPTITILAPSNTTYNLTSIPLSVTANEAINTWWFENNTNSFVQFTNNITLNVTEGSNQITVYANDSANNTGRIGVNFTIDDTPPSLTIVSPTNTTYTSNTTGLQWISDNTDNYTIMIFNGDRLDTSHANITTLNSKEGSNQLELIINDTFYNNTRIVGVNFSLNTRQPNVTLQTPTNRTYNTTTIPLSFTSDEGGLTYNYSNASDTNIALTTNLSLFTVITGTNLLTLCGRDSNYMNCSRIVFAVDLTAPTITLTSPTNTTYNQSNASVIITADEKIDTWWFENNTNPFTQFSNTSFALNTTEGSNIITFYANDSANNTGRIGINFTVDTIGPSLTILSPTNQTYLVNNTALQWISDNDDNHTIMILNNDRVDTSHSNITTLNMKEGSNQLELSINDTFNRTARAGVNFTLNTRQPNITIITPTNITYNLTAVFLSFTSDEEGLTYNYSNETNIGISLLGNKTLTTRTGTNLLTLCGNDGTFMNCSRLVFTVIVTNPIISIKSPSNITYNLTSVFLEVTADKNIDTWWFENNTANGITFNNNITLNTTEGSNQLTIYANDSSNNTGRAGINFTVDTRRPNITVHSPINITYNLSLVFLAVTSDEKIDTWYFENNTNSFTSFINNITLNTTQGSNQITIYANDSANYTSRFGVNFTVDTILPFVFIIFPENLSYNDYESFDLNITYNSDAKFFWYIMNLGSNRTFTPNASIIDTILSSNNITVYANDSAGNVNTSSIVFVSTFKAQPPNTGSGFDYVMKSEFMRGIKTINSEQGISQNEMKEWVIKYVGGSLLGVTLFLLVLFIIFIAFIRREIDEKIEGDYSEEY